MISCDSRIPDLYTIFSRYRKCGEQSVNTQQYVELLRTKYRMHATALPCIQQQLKFLV